MNRSRGARSRRSTGLRATLTGDISGIIPHLATARPLALRATHASPHEIGVFALLMMTRGAPGPNSRRADADSVVSLMYTRERAFRGATFSAPSRPPSRLLAPPAWMERIALPSLRWGVLQWPEAHYNLTTAI
jgi:hypothetical protein